MMPHSGPSGTLEEEPNKISSKKIPDVLVS